MYVLSSCEIVLFEIAEKVVIILDQLKIHIWLGKVLLLKNLWNYNYICPIYKVATSVVLKFHWSKMC